MEIQFSLARSMQGTVDALINGVHYVFGMDVEGDIAEFGTMSGLTAQALAFGVNACEVQFGNSRKLRGTALKRLHLFDSFEGLPSSDDSVVDRSSPHVTAGVWQAGTCRGISPEQLLSVCSKWLAMENITIHQGWFKDTVGGFQEDQRLALLHVDCDLYSSTIDVLVPLFARKQISEGALILFDDWNCNRASPDYGERRAWAECVERFRIAYSDEGSYGAASHKFIVHSYI